MKATQKELENLANVAIQAYTFYLDEQDFDSERAQELAVASLAGTGYTDGTPTIVCLCGSTRFSEAFRAANLRETLDGKIVLSIGCDMRSDTDIFGHLPVQKLEAIKTMLDELHMRKIDLCDEVLILNVGGYVGPSTRRELEYARSLGKHIRWLEPPRDEGN